jgi:hypothetical protein
MQSWYHRERKRAIEEASTTDGKVEVRTRERGVIKHSKWVIQNQDFPLL